MSFSGQTTVALRVLKGPLLEMFQRETFVSASE